MPTQTGDFSQELVRFYLEERGYLPSFGVTCSVECGTERSHARSEHEIDVVAARITGGSVQSVVLGCIKGYWTSSSSLSPSMVRNLDEDKKTFQRAFSDARINFVQGRFGLGPVPVKKVLFFSLRSPKKAQEAESMLRLQGIEVVYLEDIIAEILPRMAKEPYLASSTALQTIRALRGTRVFGPGRTREKKAEATDEKKGKKPKRKTDRQDEPQLSLFPGIKG